MLDLPLALPDERTVETDDVYGAVGRALTFACRFEGDCRAIAMYFGIRRAADEGGAFSIGNFAQVQELGEKIFKHPLFSHVVSLAKSLGFQALFGDPVGNVLQSAREARNELVHELTLGMWHALEAPEGIERTLARVAELAVQLAVAHRYVGVVMALVNKEELPAKAYLDAYPQEVVDWVCRIPE